MKLCVMTASDVFIGLVQEEKTCIEGKDMILGCA